MLNLIPCLMLLGAGFSLTAAQRVNVDFYGESLCPYCRAFIAKTVAPMFKNGAHDMMTFRYIAWGNAKYHSDSHSVECQHGSVECDLNIVINCATDILGGASEWFPLVECIEADASRDTVAKDALEGCASRVGLDPTPIWQCFKGDRGKTLQMQAMRETNDLDPPHSGVPWVVVNGVPVYDADEQLLRVVCAAYTGGDRPAACYKDDDRDTQEVDQLGLAERLRQALGRWMPRMVTRQ